MNHLWKAGIRCNKPELGCPRVVQTIMLDYQLVVGFEGESCWQAVFGFEHDTIDRRLITSRSLVDGQSNRFCRKTGSDFVTIIVLQGRRRFDFNERCRRACDTQRETYRLVSALTTWRLYNERQRLFARPYFPW